MTIGCYYLKDGQCRWYVTYPDQGRWRTKRGFARRRDAEQWLRNLNESRRPPPRPKWEPSTADFIGTGFRASLRNREGRLEICFDASTLMSQIEEQLERPRDEEQGGKVIKLQKKSR